MFFKIFLWIRYLLLALSFTVMVLALMIAKKHNKKIRFCFTKVIFKIFRLKLEVQGQLDNTIQLLLLNHRSLMDIIILEYFINERNTCWVAKQEITNTIFIGQIVKATNMISLDRENKRSLLKLLKSVENKVEEGTLVLIFPEGTRNKKAGLLPFKPGAKFLSEKLKLKLQAVVLQDSEKILTDNYSFFTTRIIRLHFLPSFKAESNKNWFQDLQDQMLNVLNDDIKTKI